MTVAMMPVGSAAMSVSAPSQRVLVRSRSVETAAATAVAALGAIVAMFSSAAPTGTLVWDELLKAALTAVVVAAAAKAPRWSVIFLAAVAAAASFVTLWALAAWAALAIAIGAALLDRRSRVIGAIGAAIAMQSVLRLPPAGFFGLQSIIAFVAVAPVLFLGYRYGTKRARRVSRWALGIGIAGLTAIGLIGGLALLNARSDVTQGITAARRGLEAARGGDPAVVADELDRSEDFFENASDGLSGPAARSLRLVPVVSQHQRAVEEAVNQGAIVTVEAATAVREADIRNLRLTAGQLDLDALSQMAPRLRSTSAALDEAAREIRGTSSRWLLPVLSSRIEELLDEVEQFQPEIEVGAAAAEVLPRMLGADGPRTYFVMFGTPAESRELGGFLGSWALLSFDNGQLALGESGRINELYDVSRANQVVPGTVSDWFLEMARPTRFPQNLPSSPDMAQVAAVSQQVLAGAADVPIDGFIYADGFALVDLLELSGPVAIPFQDELLTSDNAFEFFFDGQYRIDDAGGRTELFDVLAQVASGVVTGIGGQTLPGPEELGRVMGPSARGGHLQMVTFDEQANDFLRSVKLLRDFGRDQTQDFVALIQTNGLSNKLDLYLERALDYQVTIADDGQLTATARATLRSVVPSDAPPSTLGSGENAGFNKVLLSLYSPHSVVAVTANGVPVEYRAATEFGMGRYLVDVLLAPTGQPTVLEFALEGSFPDTSPYSLEVWHQPLVNTDDVTISISGPDFVLDWDGELQENLQLLADSGEVS